MGTQVPAGTDTPKSPHPKGNPFSGDAEASPGEAWSGLVPILLPFSLRPHRGPLRPKASESDKIGFGKDGKGVIIKEDHTLTVGAFTTKTVKAIGNLSTTEDFRMLKAEVQAHMTGITAGELADIYIGIANGELSAVEIAESISLDGPLDRNDRAPDEFATRCVHLFGKLKGIPGDQTNGEWVDRSNSPMMEHKFRWTYSNPEGWQYFLFNNGSTTTTGATVRMLTKNYGVWLS